jgi:hypothetical protein
MADFTNKTFKETYRDFYNAEDGYHRVLFNSGRALQARELIESQTILHEEISRFGRNLFKEGALINPGGATVDTTLEYIRLDNSSALDFNAVGEVFTSASGLEFKVLEVRVSDAIENPPPTTLYVQYTNTINVVDDKKSARVLPEETLTCTIFGTQKTLTVAEDGVISAAGRGTKAHFASGDFFVEGHFVFMEGGSTFIDPYSHTPTADIGFRIEQSIVTAFDENKEDLYDNQGDVPDKTAPGADRYQIKLIPTTRDQVEVEENFVFIARVVDGNITREVNTFDSYNRINDLLAQRTKEESGNYVVEEFKSIFKESENDDNLTLDVTKGIAYVDGYRLDIGQNEIEVPKSRDTVAFANESVPATYGNYVYIDSSTTQGFGQLNVFGEVRLKNGSDFIGYANVRGVDDDAKGCRLYLFNIRMDGIFSGSPAVRIGTENFSNVDSLFDEATQNTIPLLDGDSTLYGTSENSLLFPLPKNSPKASTIESASFTVQKFNEVTSDGAGNLSLSGVEYQDWVIAEADGPIVAVSTNNGSYQNLAENKDYVVATYQEVSSGPKSKTRTTATESFDITNVDQEARPLNLEFPDVISIISVTHKDGNVDTDITNQFILDGGQRDNFYDNGSAHVKGGYKIPTGANVVVEVEYEYFAHGAGGRYFACSSYANEEYENIPNHTTAGGQVISLRDVLDFRPTRKPKQTGDVYNQQFNITQLPQNSSSITINEVEYYLPRIDVLVANATDSRGSVGFGELQVIQGEPNINPREPEIPTGSLALYKFALNPYTFSSSDLTSTFIPNKRFTMKDIGKLEQRVTDLFELTTLSLLESSTNSLVVLDENGNARTKAGFIADNFSSFTFSDIDNPEYRASIDAQGHLKPSFRENSVRLIYSPDNSSAVTSEKSGDVVTLPYQDENLVSQTLATSTMNINPFAVITQTGHLELSPSSDEWVETRTLPPIMQTTVRRFENFEADLWNNPTIRDRNFRLRSGNNLFTTMPRDVSFRETTRSIQDFIGEQVADVEVIPFMRSRRIKFSAKGLRPNTKMFAFFGGVKMDKWVRQETSESRFSDSPTEFGSEYSNALEYPAALGGKSSLQTDDKGEIVGSFFLPNTSEFNFRTGTQEFKLLDVSENDEDEALSTTRASYTSTGSIESVQRTVRSTRVIERVRGRRDPLAQTFYVDQIENPNGLYITKAHIYVDTKDDVIPLQVQIRPVENGIPTSSIMPGAVKFIEPIDVVVATNSISGNGSGPAETMADVQASPTVVEFDEPIYLTSGEEYCIVLLAESVEYNVYVAETYKNVFGSREDRITKQPTLGSLFLSQNGFTWTPDQTKDLMFKLDRAEFDTSGSVVLDNGILPKVTLGNDPINTVLGSNTIQISHEGHGFSHNNTVTISGASSVSGIPASELNGSHVVKSPTSEGYSIELGTIAVSSISGGGDQVTASQQVYFDQYVPQIQTLIPNSTSISSKIKKTNALSYGNGRSDSMFDTVLQQEETVFLNDFNSNQVPSVIASSDNASSPTMKLILNMSTSDTKVSPLIDLQRTSALTLENVIDTDDAAQHITIPIVVDESSLGLKIIFAANRPAGADFDVYVKTAVDEDTFENGSLWVEATADNSLPSDDNPSTFRDYEYTINTDQFSVFQVKIVMKSNSSSKSPVIRDLRAIALITGGTGSTGGSNTGNDGNDTGSGGDDTGSGGDDTGSGGDDTGSGGGGSGDGNTAGTTAAAFPEISQLPSSVSVTGAPRILSQYNPESDINSYMTPNKYWHQGTRRVRLFAKFDNNGDFQLYTNDPKKGSVNVGDDELTGSTVLATGKWLDRPVQVGEIFECGFRITHVDGVELPAYSGAFPTPATPREELRNVGTGADIGYQEVISVDVGKLNTAGQMITWAGHGLVIDEHSNSLDNGLPWTVDSLHLDPTVDITGTLRIEIFVDPDDSEDNATPLTGTTSIPLDVNYTLEGGSLVDDSAESQLVLLNADDGFVYDQDPILTYYSLDSTKPKNFHEGATVADQVLTVDANSTVNFHMMWGSEQNSTINVTFGNAWTNSGSTVTLNRGDFSSFTVANAPQGTNATVTATSTLRGLTFTREIKMVVGEGATSTPTPGGGGGGPGDDGNPDQV